MISEKSTVLDWWQSAFTEEERQKILVVFGVDIFEPDETFRESLWTLANWFLSHKENLPLARKLIDKALDVGEGRSGEIADRHFAYSTAIKIYYRLRNLESDALALAIQACEDQIALAPQVAIAMRHEWPNQSLPRHLGYEQLAIIRHKEKGYDEAIRLSLQAKSEG